MAVQRKGGNCRQILEGFPKQWNPTSEEVLMNGYFNFKKITAFAIIINIIWSQLNFICFKDYNRNILVLFAYFTSDQRELQSQFFLCNSVWTCVCLEGLSNMCVVMRTQLEALIFGLCRSDNAEMTHIIQTAGQMISLGNTIHLLMVSRI